MRTATLPAAYEGVHDPVVGIVAALDPARRPARRAALPPLSGAPLRPARGRRRRHVPHRRCRRSRARRRGRSPPFARASRAIAPRCTGPTACRLRPPTTRPFRVSRRAISRCSPSPNTRAPVSPMSGSWRRRRSSGRAPSILPPATRPMPPPPWSGFPFPTRGPPAICRSSAATPAVLPAVRGLPPRRWPGSATSSPATRRRCSGRPASSHRRCGSRRCRRACATWSIASAVAATPSPSSTSPPTTASRPSSRSSTSDARDRPAHVFAVAADLDPAVAFATVLCRLAANRRGATAHHAGLAAAGRRQRLGRS